MNKFLIVLIALLFVMGLAGLFTTEETLASYSDIILAVAANLAIIMMLINGPFIKSKYFKWCKACFTILVLGILMKVMHSKLGDVLVAVPFPACGIIYFIYFLTKSDKGYLEILKLLTVIMISIVPTFFLYDLVDENTNIILTVAANCVLWITFVVFVIQGQSKKSLFN